MPTAVTITNVLGHVMTFPSGFVDKVVSDIKPNDLELNIMAGLGPAGNIAIDTNGTTKTIQFEGEFFDLTDATGTGVSSLVTGSGAPTINTKEQMKYWLESLLDGNQTAILFTSNYESYSLESTGSTTTIESVSIPGTWQATKVFITSLQFTETRGNVSGITFSMNMWVVGS